MGNNSNLSRKKLFLKVANLIVRGVYILSLILVVGGLLYNFLYPNTKGAGYPFFYEIAPFLLCSASILVILYLWKRRHSVPKPDSCGWSIFIMLAKPILWSVCILLLFLIAAACSDNFMYSNPTKFLSRALPVLSVSAVLLYLIYSREKKHKQSTKDF